MTKRLLISGLLLVLPMAGCEARKEARSERPTDPAPKLSKEAVERLEAADRLDGHDDQVIERCYVCGLGMDGLDKYPVNVEGYTAHLCSKQCQQEFKRSTEKIVLGTDVPKSTKETKAE